MIAGKPDYIIENKGEIIPVEFKSTMHNYPKKNHIYQLAAYCHLLEENYKNFVPRGVLVYNNNSFDIKFDPKLRFELESTINQMRKFMKSGKVYRNHNNKNRCKSCSMRKDCEDKLI